MANDFLTGLFSQAALELLKLRLVKVIPVPSPPAGVDFTLVVPGGIIWELIAVQGTFTASAAVATRQPSIRVFDGDGNVVMRVPPGANPTAGQTFPELFAAGYGDHNGNSGAAAAIPSPPYPIQPSWSIRSVTASLDAADQWSAIFITVREWDVTGVMQEVEELTEQFEAYTALRAGRT